MPRARPSIIRDLSLTPRHVPTGAVTGAATGLKDTVAGYVGGGGQGSGSATGTGPVSSSYDSSGKPNILYEDEVGRLHDSFLSTSLEGKCLWDCGALFLKGLSVVIDFANLQKSFQMISQNPLPSPSPTPDL